MTKNVRKAFRFDEKVYRMLKRNLDEANKKNLSESEYIRNLVKSSCMPVEVIDPEILWRMLRQAKGIKLNITQIIRKVYISEREQTLMLKEAVGIQEELLKLINKI